MIQKRENFRLFDLTNKAQSKILLNKEPNKKVIHNLHHLLTKKITTKIVFLYNNVNPVHKIKYKMIL